MANVLSNLMISKTQILTFLNIIGAKPYQIDSVREWIKSDVVVDKNGYISMQSFSEYVRSCPGYLTPLDKIRSLLIRNIVGEKSYFNIKQRKHYYEECILVGRELNEPKEPCFMALFRLLLTNEPHPYHYDYKPYQVCKTNEECLAIIRKRYGYSTRPLREIDIRISSNSTSFHQNQNSSRSRYNSSNSHSGFNFIKEKKHPSINSRYKNSNLSKTYKSNRNGDSNIFE